MARRQKGLAGQISDADFILRKITGKGISEYGKMLWQLYGRGIAKDLVTPEDINVEDRNDCLLLGAENFHSYNVFRFATKIFREEHHPDKFLNQEDKRREEFIFKKGEQAIARICDKRGWKVP